MNRKILSIGLVAVILILLVSCQKDEEYKLFEKTIVAVSLVSGNVDAAREFAASKGAEYVEYATDSDAVVATLNGKADYVVLDEYSGYLFEKENKNLCFSEKCEYNIEYRACFAIDNIELCNKFNETISVLKKDGTIDEIKNAVYNDEEYICSESTGDKGTLVMVCDPVFDKNVCFDENGAVIGTDVYIAKEICSYLGYTLVIETLDFEEMFNALDDGSADFVMSCVEQTEQRLEHYLFSDVYTTFDYNVYKLK